MKKAVIFLIGIIILSSFSTNVQAREVTEEIRYIDIEADPNFNYASTMNIVNNSTNDRFTNNALLITPFIDQTGIDGGLSSGFLPPAVFQVNSGNVSTANNNLTLATTVEFQRKNLLSGASESWWRCPYYYNGSIANSRDFNMRMSIYYTDLPRKTNLTFPYLAGGNNFNPLPNLQSHPSLVFQRTYANCGNRNDSFIRAMSHSVNIPVNDTWNNSITPDLLTLGERVWLENETEESFWVLDADGEFVESDNLHGDFQYYQQYDYSFVWTNVTAPIYPNQTYFVIWDIQDSNMGSNDAGSCYVTASDLGQNGYSRTLLAFTNTTGNYNGTIYELPIDMDVAVIFRVGLGDGVTGMKLDYNNPTYVDLTDIILDNPSFEQDGATDTDRQDHWDTSGWASGHEGGSTGTDNWVDLINSEEYFYTNFSGTAGTIQGNPTTDDYSFIVQSEGALYFNEGIHLRVKGRYNTNPSYPTFFGDEAINNGVFVIRMMDRSGAISTSVLTIYMVRASFIDVGTPSGDILKKSNEIWIQTGVATMRQIILPVNVTIPKEFFVTVNYEISFPFAFGVLTLRIYDQNNPYNPVYSFMDTTSYNLVSPITFVQFGGGVWGGGAYRIKAGGSITGYNPVTLDKTTYCERNIDTLWTDSSGIATQIQAENLYYDFELGVPKHSTGTPKNINILGVEDLTSPSSPNAVTVEQTQSFSALTGARRYFTSCFYQMRLNATNQSTTGFAVRLRLYVSDNGGSTWSTIEAVGTAVDSAWHKLATPFILKSNVNWVRIVLTFQFPAVSSSLFPQGDWKMAYVDNVTFESITGGTLSRYQFYQKVEQDKFTSTNYLSFMLPFKHVVDPDFSAFVQILFYDSNDAFISGSTQTSTVADWYDDFIMFGIKSSVLTGLSSDVQYARIYLFNFGQESYLFLHDRNSDGFLNDRHDYKFNYMWNDTTASSTILWETWFSPYYSLKTTEGQWTNADGQFTTVYFYFVIVTFVRFNDTEPEVLTVQFDTVDLKDFEAFKMEFQSFGEVFTDEEWYGYLEVKNRPDFIDKIVDAFLRFGEFLDLISGGLFSAIGKFIIDAIVFLVPLIQSLGFLILNAIVFLIAIVIYFIASISFWKLGQFFILLSRGEVEEALDVVNSFSSRFISTVSGGRLR